MDVLLSIFPGIDLLGRGFEAEGYCVTRGPDPIWGGDIRGFHVPPGIFRGIIGGSPCQDFSSARRDEPSGEGIELLGHFTRVVSEAAPEWFLSENVPRVPDLQIDGYTVQRFNLNARECGGTQYRLRCFQFGYRSGNPLVIPRSPAQPGASQPCCMASEGKRKHRRTWAEFCALQGLNVAPEFPGLSVEAKYRAVGNGVPVFMARVIAGAIKLRNVTAPTRLCVCNCGRPVRDGQTMATAACRKRMERSRKRDAAAVTIPGPVTPAASLSDILCPRCGVSIDLHPGPWLECPNTAQGVLL